MAAAPQEASPELKAEFRLERQMVPGGAELVTVFGRVQDAIPPNPEDAENQPADVPLISILRDTLGDSNPDNDRLRYVWVLTSARPTLLQRAAAAVPFFYWRAGYLKKAERIPAPVLDLSSTRKPVWSALAGTVTQLMAFDPNGALLRSTTRSYRNNARDHRQLHLLEGLAVLSQLENSPEVDQFLTEPELLAIQARLALAGQTLGGLVSEANLPEAYMKQRTRIMEDRGHNWELLRQRAEANRLYFEPFGLNGSATQALLWVAREDTLTPREFDGQFLSISNPYGDKRIQNWNGYTETRYLKHESRTVELVPLGLYSLEHPKVPLLLVDFRNTRAPKRREMIRHATVDAISGVIGYSRWGNWPYLTGTLAWNFVRAREGAAINRSSRIRAYSQVRQWLALDPNLDAGLRADLSKRLEMLGVNPMEDKAIDEARFAQRQFAALQQYAEDPVGLAALLERDRNDEVVAYDHGLAARTGLRLAYYATLGMYQHSENSMLALEMRIDTNRRTARRALGIASDAAE